MNEICFVQLMSSMLSQLSHSIIDHNIGMLELFFKFLLE